MRAAAILAVFLSFPAAARETPSYEADSDFLNPGGIVLYYDTEGPLSFRSLTPRELPGDALRLGAVRGKGCQHGLSIPLSSALLSTRISGAAGRGGTRKALAKIRAAHPDLRGLYDVKIDVHSTSVLGIYRRQCVEIDAFAYR